MSKNILQLCPKSTCKKQTCEQVDLYNSKTKMIITGSQMFAISSACRAAFSTQAIEVRMSWLTFYEYLRYKGKLTRECDFFDLSPESISKLLEIISEDDYVQYCYSTYSFTEQVKRVDSYLSSCLEETIISNMSTYRSYSQLRIDNVSLTQIYTVLIKILSKLKEKVSWQTFVDDDRWLASIRNNYNLEHTDAKVRVVNFKEAVGSLKEANFRFDSSADKFTLREILTFLYVMDLIDVSVDSIEDEVYIEKYLNPNCTIDREDPYSPMELFQRFNFTISNPMFVFCLVRELNDALSIDLFSRGLLGLTYECSIKSLIGRLYGSRVIRQLRDNKTGAEVDVYIPREHTSIELSVSDKPISAVWFSHFAECSEGVRILTTRTRIFTEDGVIRAPYFIFEAILGHDLSTR